MNHPANYFRANNKTPGNGRLLEEVQEVGN
jgi:hypothetical protein